MEKRVSGVVGFPALEFVLHIGLFWKYIIFFLFLQFFYNLLFLGARLGVLASVRDAECVQ